LAPNLAIVVNGNVNISSSVSTINATIYATGKINTCATSSGNDENTNACAQNQLSINGSLSAKNGYSFKRAYITEARSPAEIVSLAGQSLLFPPPGTESRYYYDDANGYSLDSAEYDPRF
jgi:hypothetical protein